MYKNVPPPSNYRSKGVSISFNNNMQKPKKVRDYFEDDDDDDNDYALHQNNKSDKSISNYDNDEVDPLDAFMQGVETEIKDDSKNKQSNALPEIVSKLSEIDDGEEYENHNSGSEDDYINNDDEAMDEHKKARIEPLPPIEHSTINYPPIRKIKYHQHPDITKLSEHEIDDYRHDQEISVTGDTIPRPIQKLSQAGFHYDMYKEIEKRGFITPTAIQAQSIPIILLGRDVLGLAKTGSGKTFAFIWPMIMHVVEQPQMKSGDGPIGLILVPTRELATQIYTEASKFTKVYNIRICAIYGGAGKYEMSKTLQMSPEIVVATPGRFIEMIKMKVTNLINCSMVVLDEADRMFEMGFEYQMRSIVNNIRPDRQTLLFSATMKKKIEGFAYEILSNPIRVIVGNIGQANADIRQIIEVFTETTQKWTWLSSSIDEFVADGKVLIFVSSKVETEELKTQLVNYFNLRKLDIQVGCIHGDKDQFDRTHIIKQFSKPDGGLHILVSTDLASRGLDIQDIRTVINYDIPKNIDIYVHRIGRTGRMGLHGVVPGVAYTCILSPQDSSFAVDLIQNLKLSSQNIPSHLLKLAEMDPKWSRVKNSMNRLGSNPSHSTQISIYNDSRQGSKISGGSGSSAGLGGNGMNARAMTSAQLAESTYIKSNISTTSNIGHKMYFKSYTNSIDNNNLLKSSNPNPLNDDMYTNVNVTSSGQSNVSQPLGSLIADVRGNQYIDGQSMGRGRHLLQPSWVQAATSQNIGNLESIPLSATITSNYLTGDSSSVKNDNHVVRNDITTTEVNTSVGTASTTTRRKSRFSSLPPFDVSVPSTTTTATTTTSSTGAITTSTDNKEALFHVQDDHSNNMSISMNRPPTYASPTYMSPTLSGFVRASSSYSSVHTNTSFDTKFTNSIVKPVEITIKEEVKKRSRWDS